MISRAGSKRALKQWKGFILKKKKLYCIVWRLDRRLWNENKSKEISHEIKSVARWKDVLYPFQNQHT